jgi:hypothetical protein
MSLRKFSILIAVAAILASVLACGGSISTANISDAWMSPDEAGDNRTTVFAQGDTFNLHLVLKNAPDDTQLKVVWTAVSIEGTDPNTVINETEYTSGDDTIRFYLTNDGPWPIGTYKVDIYLNGTLDRSLNFEVQ